MNKEILKKKLDGPPRRVYGIIAFIKEFLRDMNRDNVGLYAAQSTFFIVLSAIPSVMIITLALKNFIAIDLVVVTSSIQKAFPEEIASFLVQIITEVFYRSETTAVLSVAFVALLWTSSKGTMAIYGGLNEIYGNVRSQNWFKSRILSFFYNILFFSVIIASIIVLVFGNSILMFFDSEFMFGHVVFSAFVRFKFVIFFVVFILGFAALYTFLPRRKNKYRIQLWGATATALGWVLVSYGFSIYIKYFSNFSYFYGSIAAIMFMMLWLFFCIYILLIGAEINKHIETGYFKRVRRYIMRFWTKKGKNSTKNT